MRDYLWHSHGALDVQIEVDIILVGIIKQLAQLFVVTLRPFRPQELFRFAVFVHGLNVGVIVSCHDIGFEFYDRTLHYMGCGVLVFKPLAIEYVDRSDHCFGMSVFSILDDTVFNDSARTVFRTHAYIIALLKVSSLAWLRHFSCRLHYGVDMWKINAYLFVSKRIAI